MEVQIISVIVILTIITIIYKLLPFRSLGENKPLFAPMPKYKTKIPSNLTSDGAEKVLTDLGFKKVKVTGSVEKYTRGSVLGDISIKLSKVSVYVDTISSTEKTVSVQAGWVAAFDTGDHWQFLKELSEKLENA